MKLAKLGDQPEIFHSIQGEGVSAGRPVVFIRSSRCNLHCRWCDTAYTWNFEGTPWSHDRDPKYRRDDVTIDLQPSEIVPFLVRHPTKRVVITGGEPLVQQSEWLELMSLLRETDPGYTFEVETNGSKMPTPEFSSAIDQFNVSPKLSNSGMAAELRIVSEVLDYYALNPKAWFKFVVSSTDDLPEIDALAAHFQIHSERMILMPEGRSSAELDRNAPAIAEAALERGWRFSDRLHVRLWGDQRGV